LKNLEYLMQNDAASLQKAETVNYLLLTVLAWTYILAYFPVIKSLVMAWSSSDDYSHGFVIIPLVVWLLWQNREFLAGTHSMASWWGALIVALSLVLYLFAILAGIHTLASLSLITSLAGIVISLFGYTLLRRTVFPFSLLLFMIPVPAQFLSAATVPLQLFVSATAAVAATMMGIPIFREGNIIHLPEQTLQVVQACSGLRSLTALLLLGAVFAYLTLRSNPLRWLLFLCAVPVAVAVNIFRVLLIITAFYYYSFDMTHGSFHTIFGLVVFLFAILLFLSVKGVLSRWDRLTG
jgi:exosortase A